MSQPFRGDRIDRPQPFMPAPVGVPPFPHREGREVSTSPSQPQVGGYQRPHLRFTGAFHFPFGR
jgi:hypothetical protein